METWKRIVAAGAAVAVGLLLVQAFRASLSSDARTRAPQQRETAPPQAATLRSDARSVAGAPRQDAATEEMDAQSKAVFQACDAWTGRELTGAAFAVSGPQGVRQIVRGPEGFEPGPLGPHEAIEVTAEEYLPLAVRSTHLPPSGGILHLVPAEELLVECISAETLEPVPEAVVTASSGALRQATATADGAGLADLGRLALSPSAPLDGRTAPLCFVRLRIRAPAFLERELEIQAGSEPGWGRVAAWLEPALAIDVVVVDAQTGAAVERAEVVHQWSHENRGRINRRVERRLTDTGGNLAIEVRRGASRLEVVAAHREYATKGVLVPNASELPGFEDGYPELLIELEPARAVEGLVVDEAGNPVGGVTASVFPRGRVGLTDWMRFAASKHLGHLPDVAATGEDGIFRLDRLAAGEYEVALYHEGYYPDQENLPLTAAAGRPRWRGVLRRGLALEGRVIDPAGRGIAGTVSLWRPDEEGRPIPGFAKVVRVGADGGFVTAGIAPGTYKVRVGGGERHETRLAEIDTANLPRPWTIVLEERHAAPSSGGGILWLRLRDGGALVHEGRTQVMLFRPSDLERLLAFGAQARAGELKRDGLDPGAYLVVVHAAGFAPAVLDLVHVIPDPRAPREVGLSRRIPAVFELAGPAPPGWIEVRRAASGLVVAQVFSSAVAGEKGAAATRLDPGSYTALWKTEGGRSSEVAFFLAAGAGDRMPCARLALLAAIGGHDE
jgi:hypothetical protein